MTATVSSSARILIVGAGAIGAFYGAALQRQGADVSVVCRSDFDVISQSGFAIQSKSHGDQVFRPAQVVRDVADYAGGPPDYLLLTVKVVDGVDRAALIRAAVGPATTIVLIENGIEIEAEIAEAFPGNRILSALAYIQVARTGAGQVRHYAFGDLSIGEYPSGDSDALRQLQAMLEAGGIGVNVSDNIVGARWRKCLWNTAFNPISVLGGVFDTDHMLGTPAGEALIRRAMREICDVAAASGHSIPEALIDQYIEQTRKAPAYKTSMALDYENGRAMEVEAILGNAVRAAHRHAVPIPVLETLYALMAMAQRKQQGR